MKKYLLLLLGLIVFSCTTDNDFSELESIEAKELVSSKSAKASNAVGLVKAWTSYSSYRGFESYVRKFTVKVENIAFDKKVSIYHQKVDQTWEEIPLTYSFSIENGQKEIWEGEYRLGGYSIPQIYDNKFVVKYEVDGTTYWDNNNGFNYEMSRKEGYFFAEPSLNVAVDTSFVSLSYNPYTNQNSFNVTVDIRNLAPRKEVGVVYTTDGWETQSYVSLAFKEYWTNGPLFFIQSPNRFDIERWQAYEKLIPTANTVEYAIVYKVNGQEYWDNNYGKNYTVSRKF